MGIDVTTQAVHVEELKDTLSHQHLPGNCLLCRLQSNSYSSLRESRAHNQVASWWSPAHDRRKKILVLGMFIKRASERLAAPLVFMQYQITVHRPSYRYVQRLGGEMFDAMSPYMTLLICSGMWKFFSRFDRLLDWIEEPFCVHHDSPQEHGSWSVSDMPSSTFHFCQGRCIIINGGEAVEKKEMKSNLDTESMDYICTLVFLSSRCFRARWVEDVHDIRLTYVLCKLVLEAIDVCPVLRLVLAGGGRRRTIIMVSLCLSQACLPLLFNSQSNEVSSCTHDINSHFHFPDDRSTNPKNLRRSRTPPSSIYAGSPICSSVPGRGGGGRFYGMMIDHDRCLSF